MFTSHRKNIYSGPYNERRVKGFYMLLFAGLIFLFLQITNVVLALQSIIFLFALIGLFILMSRNPVVGTYAFILIELSSFHQYMPYFMSISPSIIFIFIILFALVAKIFIKKEKFTLAFSKKQSVLLLIFFGGCIINSVLNHVISYHGYYILKEPTKRLLLFFLIINFVTSLRILRNIFRILSILIVVQTLNALIFYYIPNIKQPEILHSFLLHPLSISGHPNSLGAFLVILLPILFYMVKYEVEPWRRFAFVAFFICIPTVILTFSRSAFFILLPFFFWFLLKRKEVIKPLGILSLVLTSILLIFLPQYLDRLMAITTDAGTGRIYLWQTGIRVTQANPLFGIGLSRFGDYYSLYAVSNTPFFQSGKFHNMYIDIAAIFGIPMLMIFLGFIYFTLKDALKLKRIFERKKNLEHAFLIESLIISVLLFLIGGFVFHYWLASILYILIGIIISIKRMTLSEALIRH